MPDRQSVSDLAHNEAVDEVYLLADKQVRSNRNGDLYLLTQLRDRTGQISGLMWNIREEQAAELAANTHVAIRGKAQNYQGQMQIILNHIDTADAAHLDPNDFLPEQSAAAGEHFETLRNRVKAFSNPDLRDLLMKFLDDDSLTDRLKAAPAGIKLHHAYPGGLIEHIAQLSSLAAAIGPMYDLVDTDLLVAGAILHDLGKIDELSYDASFGYTDVGQMIGHIVIGVQMLDQRAAELEAERGHPIDSELLLRLRHLIVSHHNTLEHGSPRVPQTPEAIALAGIDNLDARLNEASTLIRDDPNTDSNWTPYNANMGRKMFKGHSHS